MRVIFVYSRAIPGNPSKAIWQHIRAISDRFPCRVLTGGALPDNLEDIERVPLGASIHHRRPLVQTALFTIAALRMLVRLRPRRNEVTCCYTFHGYEIAAGALAQLMGYRWIADMVDMPELFLEDLSEARRRHRWVKALAILLYVGFARCVVRRADLVVALAPAPDKGYAVTLREKYRVPEDRLIAVNMGVDPEIILKCAGDSVPVQDTPPPPAAAEEPAGRVRLIYVGALSVHHGSIFLVNLLAAVCRRLPAELVLVGSGTEQFERCLSSLIEERGLSESVALTGELQRDAVIAWIDSSDMGLFPLPQECRHRGALPNKIGEYMARGKPTLASNIVGPGRVLDLITGLLLPPGDVAAWSEAIVDLASDAARRERMGRAAVELARDTSWPLLLPELVEAVNELGRAPGG